MNPRELLMFLQTNFLDHCEVELLARAAGAGFTGVVVADYKFGTCPKHHYESNQAYIRNINGFFDKAESLGLVVTPMISTHAGGGSESPIVYLDPSLAEPNSNSACVGNPRGYTTWGEAVAIAFQHLFRSPARVFINACELRVAGTCPWCRRLHIGHWHRTLQQLVYGIGVTEIMTWHDMLDPLDLRLTEPSTRQLDTSGAVHWIDPRTIIVPWRFAYSNQGDWAALRDQCVRYFGARMFRTLCSVDCDMVQDPRFKTPLADLVAGWKASQLQNAATRRMGFMYTTWRQDPANNRTGDYSLLEAFAAEVHK